MIKSSVIFFTVISTVLSPAVVKANEEKISRISPRITNGIAANPAEFPYMVGIEVADTNTCGGSIIKPNLVLTAAHCVARYIPLILKVRAGTAIRQDTRGQNVQMRLVKEIIIHPQYNISAYNDNDIAILVLKTPFDLNNFVNVVQLADKEYNGEDAVIIGWGNDENFNQVNFLKRGDVQVVSTEQCAKVALINYKVTPNMICSLSKSRRETICKGDSGGPMIIHDPRNPLDDILVGITSYGRILNKILKRQCDMKSPAIFTKVSAQRKWILSEVRKLA